MGLKRVISMEYTEVKSSRCQAIGYDPDKRIMGVIFRNGSEYHYSDIDNETYNRIINSSSVGKELQSVINTKSGKRI